MSDAPLLKVKNLHAWYGESHALHGVDFEVRPGEVVSLLGRNGAGKSTTMKSIMGLVPRREGSIRIGDQEAIAMRSDKIARAGLGYCPEERGIFAGLSVTTNLLLPPQIGPGGLDLETIYDLFPNLKERGAAPGTRLSGGEQQMLAIARAGLGYCPEERGIFAGLSVTTNLLLPPQIGPGGLDLETIYDLFPNLKERGAAPGTRLSGGEQQMLAIARILRTGAKLLLLDEPAEGLAPVIVQQIGRTIRNIRERGFTVLLVEQNFHFAAGLADRHYVLEHGRIIDLIQRQDVQANMSKLHDYLGV